MRTSVLVLALVLCGSTAAFSQAFKVTAVSPHEDAGIVTLFISTSGIPPANVTARDKWKVSVSQGVTSLLLESATPAATEPFLAIRYNKATEHTEIDIPLARLPTLPSTKPGGRLASLERV